MGIAFVGVMPKTATAVARVIVIRHRRFPSAGISAGVAFVCKVSRTTTAVAQVMFIGSRQPSSGDVAMGVTVGMLVTRPTTTGTQSSRILFAIFHWAPQDTVPNHMS